MILKQDSLTNSSGVDQNVCGLSGALCYSFYVLVFWPFFSNTRRAEMIGYDDPQNRKLLLIRGYGSRQKVG